MSGKINSFKNLTAWQIAKDLTLIIYKNNVRVPIDRKHPDESGAFHCCSVFPDRWNAWSDKILKVRNKSNFL